MGSPPIDGAGTRSQRLLLLISQPKAFTTTITDMADGPLSPLLESDLRISHRQLIRLNRIEDSDSPCIEGVSIHQRGLVKKWKC